MCLFVHHVGLLQQGDDNGEQKGRNTGPPTNTLTINYELHYQ